MKQTNLLFLLKDDKVLLAMKKRGFGTGRWNGVGGKQQGNESMDEAVTRETEEEIGVTPLEMQKVGELTFTFPDVPAEKEWDQLCHVYICTKWQGEPRESEEMAPAWYPVNQLPFESMWPDDPFWVPLALGMKKLRAEFSFDAEQKMLAHSVKEISGDF